MTGRRHGSTSLEIAMLASPKRRKGMIDLMPGGDPIDGAPSDRGAVGFGFLSRMIQRNNLSHGNQPKITSFFGSSWPIKSACFFIVVVFSLGQSGRTAWAQ